MANLVRGIISMTIGVVVLANVFISVVKDTNTTGWDASETALWGILSLAGIIGVVYGVFQVFNLA